MKVTVLVAVHNGGDYLREAVDSILAQTFTEFELLLVDDASTDGAIARIPDDPRIRILRNDTNLGQVPSLNRGLEEARGEYIARLDADDVMLPTRLARQVEVLDREPNVALVGTWMDVVDERGRLYAKLRGHVRDYIEFVYAILVDRYPFAHPSVMYRLAVVRELGCYDARLAPSEDKDLFRRLAAARHDARCIEAPLVRYRRHERQLSHAHADVQLANDRIGQERFLGGLVDGGEPRDLRRLLETGVGHPADVEALLRGAEHRLRLSEDERRRLESMLARRLAVRGSQAGMQSRDLRRWAARRDVAAALASLLPLAPLSRLLGESVSSSRFDVLRRVGRRSRWLRWLYARLT